jgi:hypothetical protein
LALLHLADVVLEADHVLPGFGGVVPQEFGQFLSVVGVFVDAQLQILAELLIELLVILSILQNFAEQFQTLLGDVLLDDLQDLVVLEVLPGNVQGQIL